MRAIFDSLEAPVSMVASEGDVGLRAPSEWGRTPLPGSHYAAGYAPDAHLKKLFANILLNFPCC